jgi:chemotaxis protein CheD
MKLPAWEAAAAPGTATAFLTQGNIHCSPGRSLVTTILGSCVAVCLWDRVLRQGGMNHYVLPTGPNDPPSARFGDAAIDGLHRAMLRLGCRTERMTAKLFGGAAVLPFGAYGATVGSQNVQLALRRLQDYGIPVIARRTGGISGLWLRFDTGSGEILLRSLASVCKAEPAETSAVLRVR